MCFRAAHPAVHIWEELGIHDEASIFPFQGIEVLFGGAALESLDQFTSFEGGCVGTLTP
jgi:hypothetical protein